MYPFGGERLARIFDRILDKPIGPFFLLNHEHDAKPGGLLFSGAELTEFLIARTRERMLETDFWSASSKSSAKFVFLSGKTNLHVTI
jgi:hypothetical protein